MLSADTVRRILIGTELGGRMEEAYRVNFAVPNKFLEKEHGGNSSGFSFGVVQLDIGANSHAREAYLKILQAAEAAGDISAAEHRDLQRFDRAKRPDLDAALKPTYRQARQLLNEKVFPKTYAHAEIDRATENYLAVSLVPSINRFLATIEGKWGGSTVFAPTAADYHTAVAAMVSISNRTGGLSGSTRHFTEVNPAGLDQVKARYDKVLGDHWHLVLIGGQRFRDGL